MADITELYPQGAPDGTLNIKVPAKLCMACGNIEHGSVNAKLNCLTLNLTNLRIEYSKILQEKNEVTSERNGLLKEVEPYRRIREEVKEAREKLPWKPYT
jgi:uncharacterized protein (DUF3084 family)